MLTPEQIEVLLRPIKPGRVVHRDGQSNLEAYDVRAHLTRIFGFCGWSEIAIHTELLYEEPTETRAGKPAWKVGYRADRAIVIFDPEGKQLAEYHGSAVGEGIMPDFKRGDCHDFTVKKAQSQALKRAAINLGDQFGLSLYAKGSSDAVIGKSIAYGTVQMHEPDVVEEVDPDEVPEPVLITPQETAASFQEYAERESVRPLPDTQELLVTDGQIRKIQTLFGIKGIRDREKKLEYINDRIESPVESSKQLTFDQASFIIKMLEA